MIGITGCWHHYQRKRLNVFKIGKNITLLAWLDPARCAL